MKYIVIDNRKTDIFTQEFEDKAEAIERAKNDWDRMTSYERKDCKEFFVLESVNPDEEAENHHDGDPVWSRKLKGELTKIYQFRDHEAGNLIESFSDLAEARTVMELAVEEDKEEGTYTPDFYEIYNIEDDEVVEVM